MQTSSVKGVFLVLIMFTATLSGCFGEQAKETEQEIADFQINFTFYPYTPTLIHPKDTTFFSHTQVF